MKTIIALPAFLFLFAASTPPPTTSRVIHGLIYEQGTHHEKPVFDYKRTETALPDGRLEVTAAFHNMDGTPAFTEKLEAKDARVISYDWQHLQMGESGKVEVSGNKAHYSHTHDGKTDQSDDTIDPNFVVGPTLIYYLQKHWKELKDGKDVGVRIGVPDRMSDFGFKFTATGNEKTKSGEIVHVRLKPTSIFVSAVVSPIYFDFSPDGSRLISSTGMSLLKIKRDGKWNELKAETVFDSQPQVQK